MFHEEPYVQECDATAAATWCKAGFIKIVIIYVFACYNSHLLLLQQKTIFHPAVLIT